jgi:hypothetical protein
MSQFAGFNTLDIVQEVFIAREWFAILIDGRESERKMCGVLVRGQAGQRRSGDVLHEKPDLVRSPGDMILQRPSVALWHCLHHDAPCNSAVSVQ